MAVRVSGLFYAGNQGGIAEVKFFRPYMDERLFLLIKEVLSRRHYGTRTNQYNFNGL